MRCLPQITAFLILATLTQADAGGQESITLPPEMKPLEGMVGTWNVEQENKVPEQTRVTYVLKGQSILDGRFIQQTGASQDAAKPMQMGMYTYDASKKNYRYWFFMSSGFFTDFTGSWDEGNQTFTFTNRSPGGREATIATRFLDETTFVFSMINKAAGGEIVYQMEGKAVRQE
jgi:hypothetical protein